MEQKIVEIETRLGRRSVDASRIITFPRGLVGFESEQRFVLLQIKDDAPLLVLQSVQTPQLGLLVTDPKSFMPDFQPRVSDSERTMLGLKDLTEAAILVTVSIPPGEPERATLNMTGPIVINYLSCVGMQIPQNDMPGPAQVNLNSLVQSAQNNASTA